jgi:tetratricopeptide (TPR) repeat protein
MSRTKSTLLMSLAIILLIASFAVAQEEPEATEPPTPQQQYEAAMALVQQRSYDDALAGLAPLREDATYGAHATYYSALCLSSLGKFEEALPFFEASIEAPAFASAKAAITSQYADTLFMAKKFDAALAIFLETEVAGAADAMLLNNIAICYTSTKKDDEAAEYFTKSLAADPEFVDSMWRLGLLLATNKKYDEALPYLEQYYELKPRTMEGREVKKAMIISYDNGFKRTLEASQYTEALAFLEKLNTLAPNSTEAKEAMESKAVIEEELNKAA